MLAAGARASRAARKPPGSSAEQIRADLFDARSELLLDGRRAPSGPSPTPQAAVRRQPLRAGLAGGRPRRPRRARAGARATPSAAVAAEDPVALARRLRERARGAAPRRLRRHRRRRPRRRPGPGPRVAADPRLPRGDALHPARRSTRPPRSTRSRPASVDPGDAVIALRKDLYDAYQSRLVTYLDEARIEASATTCPPSPSRRRSPAATGRSSPPSTRRSAAPAARERGRPRSSTSSWPASAQPGFGRGRGARQGARSPASPRRR